MDTEKLYTLLKKSESLQSRLNKIRYELFNKELHNELKKIHELTLSVNHRQRLIQIMILQRALERSSNFRLPE